MNVQALLVAALMSAPAAVIAETATVTVYRSVGADGVVVFSDEHSSGATAIELETVAPRPEDVERAGELYQQQLDLIGVLETDRRASEAVAAERRQTELDIARARAATAAREVVESEPRYVYAPWYAPRPYPPYRGGHGEDPPRHPPPAKPSPSNSRPLGIGSR